MKNLNKILVVEDDTAQREVYVSMLLRLGFEVEEASNVNQAEENFSKFQPDLVLMDIKMRRGVDGVAIAGVLRSKGIPFALVFMTGYSKEDYDFKHTRHVEPQDFIRKNEIISIETLSTRLEVAWGNFQKHTVYTKNITIEKVGGLTRVIPTKEESLKVLRGFDSKIVKVKPEFQAYKDYIIVSNILFIQCVRGDSKQVKLFMNSGKVYRKGMGLLAFLRLLNQDFFIQINGSVAVNAEMARAIRREDGKDIVELGLFDKKHRIKKFEEYINLDKELADAINTSTFQIKGKPEKRELAIKQLDQFIQRFV